MSSVALVQSRVRLVGVIRKGVSLLPGGQLGEVVSGM